MASTCVCVLQAKVEIHVHVGWLNVCRCHSRLQPFSKDKLTLSARPTLFHCLPDLVYFAVRQIWSISLSVRSGLFHCLPDLVYFTVCQIWSISLSARSGLFHCPSDLVYFTVCQICHCPSDLAVCQIWSISLSTTISYTISARCPPLPPPPPPLPCPPPPSSPLRKRCLLCGKSCSGTRTTRG